MTENHGIEPQDVLLVDGEQEEGAEEDWFDDPNRNHDYLKYVADQVETVADLSKRLREVADVFDRMAVAGWELEQPVEDGHVFLIRSGHTEAGSDSRRGQ